MAKYIAILQNKKNETLTTSLLQNHVRYLKNLHTKGVLFLCGPFKDNDGAMQILEVASYEDAENYLLQDPFVAQKYYANYNIYELIEANVENNYLIEDTQTKSNLKQF